MFIKKMNDNLAEALPREGFAEPKDFQKDFLKHINSGSDIVGIAQNGAGKTMSLLIATLHRLNNAEEFAPRAIIVVEDDEQILKIETEFKKLTRFTDLRIDALYSKKNVKDQIDWIFEGTDLVVGSARRVNQIYLQNGLNVNKLLIFAVDDANVLMRNQNNSIALNRLFTGLPKCQKLICCNEYSSKLEILINEYLPNPIFVLEEES